VRLSQFTGASINAVTRSGDNTFKGSFTHICVRNHLPEIVLTELTLSEQMTEVLRTMVYASASHNQKQAFLLCEREYEKELVPGVDWNPSTDGVANSDLKISRTLESDMILVKNFLMSNYDYDPGKYRDFDPFQNKNTKILARIDWNISNDHKFTLRYNDVVGTSDQQTNATSGPPNNLRNSGRISNQSLAFSNAFYGFKNTVRSITGELNSNFGSKAIKQATGQLYIHEDARTSNSTSSLLLISGRTGSVHVIRL